MDIVSVGPCGNSRRSEGVTEYERLPTALTKRCGRGHGGSPGYTTQDVMRPMQKKGMLSAPVRKLIFTKVDSQKNEPAQTPGGILSPFKAAQSSQAGMDAIAESLCAATIAVEDFGFCLHDHDKYAPLCPPLTK